jgi:pimeloyl-ACP methyl ester carboxylesterase
LSKEQHTASFPSENCTVTANGVDLHYQAIGNGPALFLVSPGWGVGSAYLQRGFNSLSEHFRLVFVDTRGSGLSGRPVDPSKMGSADMADDLEALRMYLGLSEISILRHSKHDYICPLALSEHLHKGIPQSQLTIFEESGHFPWLEEPEEFFAILNGFLSS